METSVHARLSLHSMPLQIKRDTCIKRNKVEEKIQI